MEKIFPNLEKLTGERIEDKSSEILSATRSDVKKIFDYVLRIEDNKNKLDLKPGLEFVEDYLEKFDFGLKRFLAKTPSELGKKIASEIEILREEDLVGEQVTPEDIKKLLARMPEALIKLSKLKNVDYHLFGKYKKVIPVPGFDEEGHFDSKKVELVPFAEFPRAEDHPTRILVGVSNGEQIFPTPIPQTVSADKKAIKMYQILVFMHEFFHTIDYPRRNAEARSKVNLQVDGQEFTFQEWWKAFEELLVSNREPGPISGYAETYKHQLSLFSKMNDEEKFTAAVAEQICETFVAYLLNIIPNNQNWTNFQEESFENTEQFRKYVRKQSPAANLKWILMDKLCRAEVE